MFVGEQNPQSPFVSTLHRYRADLTEENLKSLNRHNINRDLALRVFRRFTLGQGQLAGDVWRNFPAHPELKSVSSCASDYDFLENEGDFVGGRRREDGEGDHIIASRASLEPSARGTEPTMERGQFHGLLGPYPCSSQDPGCPRETGGSKDRPEHVPSFLDSGSHASGLAIAGGHLGESPQVHGVEDARNPLDEYHTTHLLAGYRYCQPSTRVSITTALHPSVSTSIRVPRPFTIRDRTSQAWISIPSADLSRNGFLMDAVKYISGGYYVGIGVLGGDGDRHSVAHEQGDPSSRA
jgi:hypothetical protein